MNQKQSKRYERPEIHLSRIDMRCTILAGSVNVGDWNDGGSLGGGEATEDASQRRGAWGDLWNE